jgi:hypothetical protein
MIVHRVMSWFLPTTTACASAPSAITSAVSRTTKVIGM